MRDPAGRFRPQAFLSTDPDVSPADMLAWFSLITLFADEIHNAETIVVRSTRWYAKEAVTFSDALAAVRRQLWTDQTFDMSRQDRHPSKSSEAVLNRLIDLACYAA